MALTIDDIGIAVRDAIRDSTAILNFCTTNFSKTHSVYYGSTGSKSPPPEDHPAFGVVPWAKERGEDEENRIFTISVMLYITDETRDSAQTGSGVIYITYRGLEKLEDLLDLAMTAIKGISSELFFDDKTWEFDPMEHFPMFVGELTLTVTFPILIGGFEPTIT